MHRRLPFPTTTWTEQDTTGEYCKRYGHTTGRCRSRQAFMESGRQRKEAHQHQHQRQDRLEINTLNERGESEITTSLAQFEAETTRLESETTSPEEIADCLLHELQERETPVDGLREWYAKMRSPVAQRYNIKETQVPTCGAASMDVDAAPQPSPPHATTESVPPIMIPDTVPRPQTDPPPSIAEDAAADAVSDGDDEDADTDDEPNDDNDNDAAEADDAADDDVPSQPASVPSPKRPIKSAISTDPASAPIIATIFRLPPLHRTAPRSPRSRRKWSIC